MPRKKSRWPIKASDIAHPGRRGFARLKSGKLRQIAKAASKLGACKGGRSMQTRAGNLKKGKFFENLERPFPKMEEAALKMDDAAKVFGVSRQAFRGWVVRYSLPFTRRRTATMFLVSDLRDLHAKLRKEFKDELKEWLRERRQKVDRLLLMKRIGSKHNRKIRREREEEDPEVQELDMDPKHRNHFEFHAVDLDASED